MKTINKKLLYFLDAVIFIILLSVDRLSKYYVIITLKNHPAISVIPGILEFNFLENTGAAFGLLKNQKAFFIFVSVIIVLTCLYCVIKFPAKKKYTISNIMMIIMITGIAGNVIDRVLYDYVVDFISFNIIGFPIFNISDVYVSLASIVIIFLLLFVYDEDDLNFLRFLEKKLREIDR